MISFASIKSIKQGQLFEMLNASYKDLIETFDRKNKEKYLESWGQFDKNTFDNADIIGKCLFVSRLDNKLVGFASYDPRHFPNYGIIGQNCVLPEFKRKGYGKLQIQELLRIFNKAHCLKAFVTTGDNDFFIPAQNMYKSLGFKETTRQRNIKWGFKEIKYQLLLNKIIYS